MKNIASIATVSLALLLGATACSTGGEVTPAAAPAATSAPAPVPATPEPADDGTASFGETFTYKDGIAVTVSAPELSTAGQYAAGAEASGGEIQVFTVTLVNGTSEVLDPIGTYITANFGADGTAAQQVFDSASGLGLTFEGKILPGKKQVGKVAFAIPAAETDVLVSVTPDFAHDAALFQAK